MADKQRNVALFSSRQLRSALLVLLLCGGGLSALRADTTGSQAQQIHFNRDIRPLITDNCFLCHGPDPGTRKAGLRFDRVDGLFSDRKTGKTIIKGDAEHSLLYQRITNTDNEKLMPPPASHKSLSPQQRQLIKDWINQGANWEPHWSFVAPVRPAIPAVKTAGWVRNPIDAFVLAKLESKRLSPAPEADRRTLARRLSFDLTGLPPKPEVVDAFVADADPNAYEKLVDQMLSSKEYGEHRARYWLDAARYADSNGLHFDNYREMWPFRDWVIGAFNQNLPFDQFVTQQLAGDLLPHPTMDQLIASGFNRANETTNEGGTIAEENLVFYTRDRTETAARVFMGLTYNCAVCHDHKFDPITQKDFYSLSAFFNNSTMGALDGNIKDTPPVIQVPRGEDRPRWNQIDGEIAAVRQQLEARRAAAHGDFDKFLASAANDPASKQTAPADGLRAVASMAEGEGSTFHLTMDGQSRDVPLSPGVQWQAGHAMGKAPHGAQGALAEVPDLGDFDVNQPFTCGIWMKLPGAVASGAILSRMTEKDNYRGWDIWVEGNRIGSHFIHQWNNDAIKVVSNQPVDPAKWHHVCLTYDGSAKAAGLKIYIDGAPSSTHAEADNLKPTDTTRTDAPFKLGQRFSSSPINGLAVEDLHIYGRALSPLEVGQLSNGNHMAELLLKTPQQRTAAETNEVFGWWLTTHDEPYKQMSQRVEEMEAEKNAIKSRGATTLVMAEQPRPATAFVLFRGDYDKRRDEVTPATPQSLPPYPADAPRNRLGLAHWLLEPNHPLTARVAVNRYWQEIFGTGLVKTTEDFGIMGETPSNQELLDWLAVDFRESGWDVKRMFKQIVMSATYRQAATTTPQKLEIDPENRLLSRGPRFRLDAEEIRDSALAASGLLVEKVGGPSVRPYQPPGVWEAVAMLESNLHNYVQDHGESLYRRSMYTFWKRAAPPASMDVFNAPSRETCTVRRERTDTPLQALVTMNDPQFVEAARNLAQHAMTEGGETPEARIDYMTRRLLSRSFTPQELTIARGALDDLLGFYRAHADEATKLISIGESPRDQKIAPAELAAWTMLANQLLNLDECLNK